MGQTTGSNVYMTLFFCSRRLFLSKQTKRTRERCCILGNLQSHLDQYQARSTVGSESDLDPGVVSSILAWSDVETVSSLNHIFSWASLIKQLTRTLLLHAHILAFNCQQPFLNKRKDEDDQRNYFMINLHKSMRPGRD